MSRCADLAFLVDLPDCILDAVAYCLPVNIKFDVIHNVRLGASVVVFLNQRFR